MGPVRLAGCALAASLAACDTPETTGIGRSVLAEELSRAVAEVPAFGGIAFERPVGGRSGLVVYTLGDDPEAEADLRSRLGGLFSGSDTLHVLARPAVGNGSDALARQVAALVSRPLRAEYDARTGYVRVGFWTETAAAGAYHDLKSAGITLGDVIVQVEDRSGSN